MALRVRVCKLSDVVPGELRAYSVDGVTWPVIVTRLDDALVAVPGVCPHEDVGLAGGGLVGNEIVCPGHGWAFDLRTGRCRHNTEVVLRRYPVSVIDGDVWVDLV